MQNTTPSSSSISLDWLKSFVVFADSPNISVAATRLQVSQPALTTHLKRLEEELDSPLFEMVGRKKVLTTFGRELHSRLRTALPSVEQSITESRLVFGDEKQVTLRIGMRREILNEFIERFQFPGQVAFTPQSSDESVFDLQRGAIDIAITRSLPESSQLIAKRIYISHAELIIPKKWVRGNPTLKDLKQDKFFETHNWVAYSKDYPYISNFFEHLKMPMPSSQPKMLCEDWNLLARAAELEWGYTVMPSGLTVNSDSLYTIAIPKEAIPEVAYYALMRKQFYRIPTIKAWIEKFKT